MGVSPDGTRHYGAGRAAVQERGAGRETDGAA